MAIVPLSVRPAIRAVLDQLVDGQFPNQLTWVSDYGETGAVLIRQPDSIWEHPRSDVLERQDGFYAMTLPLWTTDESPSELSAELGVSPEGVVTLEDVHVL
ncbi:hypothetical protein [Phycicoccus sp. Root101]|uniref:DUF7668 domain-containing protein n=1 Tax=Phycicoccus sp. Root101 TaxID=1736421 RepID=UPI0007028A0E|nr:hypothetical protein [Phycicoccus sp. Root101]KQU68300.1 hypothetical protein ASC58_12185 [Phycicoccus sp. Root101]